MVANLGHDGLMDPLIMILFFVCGRYTLSSDRYMDLFWKEEGPW